MLKNKDFATIILGIALITLLFTNQFMFIAKSRIGEKIGLTAENCLGKNYIILLLLTILLCILIFFKKKSENLNFITGALASICFGLTILFAGQSVNEVEFFSPSTRISMSIGCYSYLVLAYIIEVKCNELICKTWKKFIVITLGIFIAIIAFFTGKLDGLSVLVEYYNRQSQFNKEFLNHIAMSFSVVISGIIIGIPLGWVTFKKEKVGNVISTILNAIESIPSLALICAMMFPIAFISNHVKFIRKLGFSGIGATPVFCALLFYALFQIVNSMYGALKSVDKKYIEVAMGLGMNTKQIFTKIELPIILPVIISGIRVSLISTILGVTIGSYVGYGGLGIFILQGLNGFAVDIVLLGTLPIMAMVLTFDFLFKKIVGWIEHVRKVRGITNI